MWNFKKKDRRKGYTVENLTVITSMTGLEAESNFHMIPCSMHALAGPMIPKVFLAHHLIWESRNEELAELLRDLAALISEMQRIFSQVRKLMKREV